MKKNTQKLLLSLLNHRIELRSLKIILPELTDGGRRSLLHVLKDKELINSERALGVTSIGITQYGISALEALFPALSSKWDEWQGGWDCLVFVQAPKSDKQFRYLRMLLLSEGAVSISRGVYICPFSFSERVVRECKEMYHSSILMFSVGDWKIANLRNLIVKKYGLIDLAESYSGISKEVFKLLESVSDNNRLANRHKIDINLVYDRLRETLKEDPGFCHHYFGKVPKAKKLILDLNSIISRY